MGWSWKVLFNPDHSVIVLWKVIVVPQSFVRTGGDHCHHISAQSGVVLVSPDRSWCFSGTAPLAWISNNHSVQEPVEIWKALSHSLNCGFVNTRRILKNDGWDELSSVSVKFFLKALQWQVVLEMSSVGVLICLLESCSILYGSVSIWWICLLVTNCSWSLAC